MEWQTGTSGSGLSSIGRQLGWSRSGIWLKSLTVDDRKIIGIDIKTVEFGWPVGMPTCRSLGNGLWEVRSSLTDRKIGRVIFSIRDGEMYVLHGFIKKSQKTSEAHLDVDMSRRKDLES